MRMMRRKLYIWGQAQADKVVNYIKGGLRPPFHPPSALTPVPHLMTIASVGRGPYKQLTKE